MTTQPDAYVRLFETATQDQVLGEASTWYLSDYHHVIPHIRRLYGERAQRLKIIILLRNPADRAWSQYLMKLTENREDRDFGSALDPDVVASRLDSRYSITYDYLGTGLYYSQVKAYLESFPQVMIHVYEEFFKDTGRSMREVYRFLGLDPPKGRNDFPPVNVSGRARGRFASFVLDLVYKPNLLKSIVKGVLPQRIRTCLKYGVKNRFLRKQGLSPELKRKILEGQMEDIHSLERLLGRELLLWYQAFHRKEGA
jgi:hypothetical protein